MSLSPWEKVTIKDIAYINPDSISPKTPKDRLINYIDLESVKSGKILGIKEMKFSDAPSRAKRLVKKDDVLFSTVRPYQKNFTLIRKEKENLIASTGFAVLRAKEISDSRFIYQTLYSDLFMNQIISEMKGSNYPAVNASDVEKVEILLPPLQEQIKIASILSKVDEQIDETEQLIVKTKELKKGLMQQLLTKGIGHTKFKQTQFGEIPSEWQIKSIKDIFELISGYAFKSKLFKSEAGPGTLQVIKMGNVKQGKLDLIKNKAFILKKDILESQHKYKLISEDIVLSLTGTVGKRDYGNVALIEQDDELVVNQRVGCLRKTSEKIDSKYYYYALQTEVFRMNFFELGVGGTGNQSNVSLSDMGEIKIPCPTLAEQQKIASILSTVDEQIKVYEEEKAKYEELKKGLMQQLLTGQIRVKI